MRVLKLGQKNHIDPPYIVYCGMPSKEVFSIAVSEYVTKRPITHAALSYNVYYPVKTHSIIAGGKMYQIHNVTPDELTLQEMM